MRLIQIISTLLFSVFIFFSVHSNSKNSDKVSKTKKKVSNSTSATASALGSNSASSAASAGESQEPTKFLTKPKLKPGQFTALFKNQYHIFEVKEFSKLTLSTNCFSKSAKPKCQAFDIAQIKVKDIVATIPGQTNPASMHCQRMQGDDVIAYDYTNNEFDYCRFSDDSLVDSWSMFDLAYVGNKK